ncbi:MAG: PilZ domain-containing protein [Candidatus Omnitrophota bacterium]|nr:PilZ domain-containing protein [Candidatus Omnitrophota bacterium]
MLAETNNRLFERVSGELAVRYSPQGTDGEFCSTTRNISGGGIRMPLLKKLKPGSMLNMEVFKHNTDIAFRCMGKVMWAWDAPSDAKENHIFEAGIKFINPDLLCIGKLIDSLEKNSLLAR